MTCIAALVDNGTVWMGGDSAGVAGIDLVVRKDPKVFRLGPLLIGYTSSFRMGQLLRFSDDAKHAMESRDCEACEPFEAMVRYFVPAIRKLFTDHGFATKNNNVESAGTFLVGYRSRLFSVEDDYQVGEVAGDINACGCGAQLALGSLLSTLGQKPRGRVRMALECAEHFSAGVRGPFTILSLEPPP